VRAGVNGGLRCSEFSFWQRARQTHLRLLDRGVESALVLVSQACIAICAQTFTEIAQRADMLARQDFAQNVRRRQKDGVHFICAT
jgi:hypothetical protein